MKKFAVPLLILLPVALTLGVVHQFRAFHQKYAAQTRQIQQLRRELAGLKKELFYLQSLNYSQYIRAKQTWKVIEKDLPPKEAP